MTEKASVIFIQKDKFQFFSPVTGKVFEFRFASEMVRDLDVINAELLESQIKVFVTNGKISPGNLIFALAENAYFAKDFVQPAPVKGTASQPAVNPEIFQKQADEFIEHVPFDNVVSKTIPLKDGIKVVATNKDFYEAVAISFEHLGFTIESVLPGLVLGNGLSQRPVMDPPMANLILQKVNTLRQYNLLNQQVYTPLVKQETEEVDEVEIESKDPKKANKKSIYALIGIAPVVIGLFVVLYMQMTAPPPKWKTEANPTGPAVKNTAVPTVQVTALPNSTSASASGSLQTQTLTVQIASTATSASIAQKLLGQLDTLKFKSVSLQSQSTVSSGSTLVSFAPTVTPDVRNAVLAYIKQSETNVIVQDKQLGTFDISIVLGQ